MTEHWLLQGSLHSVQVHNVLVLRSDLLHGWVLVEEVALAPQCQGNHVAMLANQFCGQTWSRECSAWLANVEDLIADVANSKTSQLLASLPYQLSR